ncbi:MAG: Dabb family protein [Acidimicrobiia bacterium]|nr:Dabb family protein [Acidimicrobiia bacterium]
MIHHVVMFRFRDGVTDDQVTGMHRAITAMPDAIDTIVEYRCGADLDLTDGTWDYALVGSFRTWDDYEVYRDHPVHQSILSDVISPLVAEKARVQFET